MLLIAVLFVLLSLNIYNRLCPPHPPTLLLLSLTMYKSLFLLRGSSGHSTNMQPLLLNTEVARKLGIHANS